MKIMLTLKTLLFVMVLAISLFAAKGTAWADDSGVSWEQVPDVTDPIGISWED
jgi:hypothetical protein